jgi:hypothetical protein
VDDASSEDDQELPLHSKRDRGRAATPSGRAPAAKRGKRNGLTPAAMKGSRLRRGAAGEQSSPTRPRGRKPSIADDSGSDGMDEDSGDDGAAVSDQRGSARPAATQAARKAAAARRGPANSGRDSRKGSRRGGRALAQGKVPGCICIAALEIMAEQCCCIVLSFNMSCWEARLNSA